MGILQKLAALKRLGSTPEERSIEISRRVKLGWSRKTPDEIKKHMDMMEFKRWNKK